MYSRINPDQALADDVVLFVIDMINDFLLPGEPGELLGRQRTVVEAIGQEGVGPRLYPARVELAPPRLDALDRGAEMGAVADGERGDAIGPRQRGGQRHRAADRFAHEMKLFQPGGVGDGEQILDQEIERPGEIRRGNVRARRPRGRNVSTQGFRSSTQPRHTRP